MCSRQGPPARPARGICNERRTPPWGTMDNVDQTSYVLLANDVTTVSDSTTTADLDWPTLSRFATDSLATRISTIPATAIGIGGQTWQLQTPRPQPNLGFFARQGRRLDTGLFHCAESVQRARQSIRSISVSTLNRMRNAGSMTPSLSGFWSRRLRPALLVGPVVALLLV